MVGKVLNAGAEFRQGPGEIQREHLDLAIAGRPDPVHLMWGIPGVRDRDDPSTHTDCVTVSEDLVEVLGLTGPLVLGVDDQDRFIAILYGHQGRQDGRSDQALHDGLLAAA